MIPKLTFYPGKLKCIIKVKQYLYNSINCVSLSLIPFKHFLFSFHFSSKTCCFIEPLPAIPVSTQTADIVDGAEREQLFCQIRMCAQEIQIREQQIKIQEQQAVIDQQRQQLLDKDAEINEFKNNFVTLKTEIKTLQDNRFQQTERFFLKERNGITNRVKAGNNISTVLFKTVLDNESQLRVLVSRITACEALEAPYNDLLDANIKFLFCNRLYDSVTKAPLVDYENVISVIGNHVFHNKHMNFYAEFLNSKLPQSQAIMLKTTEFDTILSGSEEEISHIRNQLEGRSKILVPLRMENIAMAHWFLYSIDVSENPPAIVCYDTIRRGKYNTRPDNGAQFFPKMEAIASRLFPERFPATTAGIFCSIIKLYNCFLNYYILYFFRR